MSDVQVTRADLVAFELRFIKYLLVVAGAWTAVFAVAVYVIVSCL